MIIHNNNNDNNENMNNHDLGLFSAEYKIWYFSKTELCFVYYVTGEIDNIDPKHISMLRIWNKRSIQNIFRVKRKLKKNIFHDVFFKCSNHFRLFYVDQTYLNSPPPPHPLPAPTYTTLMGWPTQAAYIIFFVKLCFVKWWFACFIFSLVGVVSVCVALPRFWEFVLTITPI